MELSPTWEAASCLATQEIPNILWKPKFHYRVHKRPPLVPILSQIDPAHTTPTYISKIHLNIILSRPCLPSGLFPSGIPTKTLYAFLVSPYSCYIPCLSHSPWLDHPNYTWRRVQVMKLLIMQFSSASALDGDEWSASRPGRFALGSELLWTLRSKERSFDPFLESNPASSPYPVVIPTELFR
jgi:hypothetical protein